MLHIFLNGSSRNHACASFNGEIIKIDWAAGVSAGATYLSKSENRQKLKGQLNKGVKKLNKSHVKNWGKPSEIDDAEMVNEGAMTSVQSYNKLQKKSQDK